MAQWFRRRLGERGAEKPSGGPGGSSEDSYLAAIDMIYSGRGVGASLFSNAATVDSAARTEWIARNQGVIVWDGREIMIDGSVLNESALGAGICHDKALTKTFLLAAGVRTPRGQVVRSENETLAAANQLSGPVVVKPVGGGLGRGVTVGVLDEDDLREAYSVAAGSSGRRVLVEESIAIESEYRCMATADKCVSVIERVLPYVVGDGLSSIRELVRNKNEERTLNPAIHNLLIPLDHVVDVVLGRQGLDLDSIPPDGQRVLVRNVGGLSGGGDPIDRFNEVSPGVKELASRAILAVPDLAWGGVDVAVERNTGVPYVIEINARAGFGAATFPIQGESRDVASIAWCERQVMTSRDLPKANERMELARKPQPVSFLLPSRLPGRTLTFADLFFAWLGAQGYVLERHAGAVRVSGRGIEKWFLPNAASGLDRLATHRVVRRHDLVRRLLDRKNVRRVRGRLVSSASAVERLFPDKRRVIATPKSHRWGTPRSIVLDSDKAQTLFNGKGAWVVQAYPSRGRLIAFATRTCTLAILQDPSEDVITTEGIKAVASAAVDAVRAIPELRWAAVDLVVNRESVPSRRQSYDVLVEGVVINRFLTGSELVIAGSMEDMWKFVLEG